MAEIFEKVSGTGALSERTDLNVSNQPARYISGLPQGQGQATYDQQTAAPMAGVPETPGVELEEIVPLGAPTQFPNQPISYGANWGEGPGLSAVVPQPVSALTTLEKTIQYDNTGLSEFLYNRLNK